MKPEDHIGEPIRYDGTDWIIGKVRYKLDGVYVDLTSVDGRYIAMVRIEDLLTSDEPPDSGKGKSARSGR